MADDLLDIEALLAPLPDGDGGGEDPQNDFDPNSVYRDLSDMRRTGLDGDRAQDASDEDPVVPPAWRDVRRLGVKYLETKGKNFVAAAWLTEAMVRLEGLPGLEVSAQLIEQLTERYWENGFPRPDTEGLEDRAIALGGLAGEGNDGTLMQPIRRVPMFRRGDGRMVALHLWLAAEDTAMLGDETRKKARLAAGVPEFEVLEREARADSQTLRVAATQALAAKRAWVAMDAKLNEKFGSDAPSTRRVTEALDRIIGIGEKILGSVGEAPAAEAEATVTEGGPVEASGGGGGGAGGPERKAVRTREDAIRALEEIAEWFRRQEPHSPLAYTLIDAARRARLPLPDLLAEVLPDETARNQMLSMLGIRVVEKTDE